MAYQIIATKRFANKVSRLLHYLELNWGERVANKFEEQLLKRLIVLSNHPFVGANSGRKNCRSILLTKHNKLYYRINNNTIEVLNMYDTRMRPSKNPFHKK